MMARRALHGLPIALWLACGAGPTPARAETAPAFGANEAEEPALMEAARLLGTGQLVAARQLVDRMAEAGVGGTQRDFLDGMISYSSKDYRRAETVFRRMLDYDPRLVRVRLELARTLFMEHKDEQADYHFTLAAAAHPQAQVLRNIANFRDAIRQRRSWRFSLDIGFAPDSNINSATAKEIVDIQGLPFRLDPDARARSGTGRFVGGDASVRLNRGGDVPIYLGSFGRWTRHKDHRFDDLYLGVEAGPEFNLAGGRLRASAIGLKRWYGGRSLVTSFGARFGFEKLIGQSWSVGGRLQVRHHDYSERRDVDGWDVEGKVSASRPLGLTALGFADLSVERSKARDAGQSYWRQQLSVGILKEIGWGLRPQLSLVLARQVNDGLLAPFGKRRRDQLIQGSLSIHKRDWNVYGFAPSLSVTFTRNRSTLTLYDQKRTRGEIRFTKAF